MRDPRSGQIHPLRGTDSSFRWIPNGVPGLETRMPLLFPEGVGKGIIDLERFVELTATNPARVYGLYPRKGTIAVGCDADIVIWDDSREVTISNDLLHHDVDYTPYEGITVTGWPAITLARGEVVWADGDGPSAGEARFYSVRFRTRPCHSAAPSLSSDGAAQWTRYLDSAFQCMRVAEQSRHGPSKDRATG